MNLRGIWAVFRKEFRENLRDRRTLLSALVFGPVLGPMLVAGVVQFSISHSEEQYDENITIAVIHGERAPNLLAYLNARGVDSTPVDLDEAGARRAVADQTHKVILDIPEDFGARLQEGQPAPVILYSDRSRNFDRQSVERVRSLVGQYGLEIAQLRYLARGIDPISVLPLSVQEVDVSTPSSRSVLVLNMMTYLVILSMLFGGLYLAIDATAGERERGSLEMLLTSPVPREHLIYGKILAAAAYMAISLMLTVAVFSVSMSFVGLERLGITANLGPRAAAKLIACCSPLILFGASYLSIVSGFAKSYREAQTYLGLVITLPTMPLLFAGLLGLQAKLPLMLVPFLSQHLLMTTVVRAEPIEPALMVVSVASTLVYGGLLMWLAGRLYRREGLLG
ncbi:MAG TPA: ABC transporter permease [Steroidobacteraceae bacterium]|jgi:sodium transport system permease protein|nr:ABC transporter permease [Steroidobacteraceae bacterium]